MTLTRRMAHARIELHKKLSFNDIHPMTFVSKFSVSHFHMFADLVSLTHLALIFLTHLAELVSLTHARIELHKKLSFNDIHPMTFVSTFSVSHFHMFADLVSLTHLALIFLTHLAELVSLTHLALGCLTHLADLLLTHLALI